MSLLHSALPRVLPYQYCRSWLLVAASQPHKFGDAFQSPADAVVLDLEDGVTDAARADARTAVAALLRAGHKVWVRINPATTEDWDADLAVLRDVPALRGIMLAKAEFADHVDRTAEAVPGVPIIALVETALGIENAFEVACAKATARIAFGSGDFRRDTAAADTPAALSYARARLVVASRAACIAGPIDGPSLARESELSAALSVTKTMGMTGKLTLAAWQLDKINSALSPKVEEVAWAADTVQRLGPRGENIVDGYETPNLARAKHILCLSEVYSPLWETSGQARRPASAQPKSTGSGL
ncbi:HpcH/HpaI aldolase/citrate lyase family protein [Mycolicibacterium helvum]|uniref:Putative citrate lyase/aldolase n=1 Tax=Mycolicibacterium helvum TaxID=1534349 RepID=A0A7I7T9G2_9MYCO|nr:aldolase/citrate lyase family protein [Mycolicibacterium helvum]BBY65894.1 putative citrate lyase/aldolase [Mycolicibacterium helvum]